jgi:hypothetical protein
MRKLAAALFAALSLGLAAPAALAQTAPPMRGEARASEAEVAPLVDALGLGELLPIMRDEGLAYGADIAADMFPGQSPARWNALVDEIYDADRMRSVMTEELAQRLTPTEVDTLMQFFDGELGRRIVRLEVSARRALLDDAVEEASIAALEEMRADDDPRLELLTEFIEVNELVEMNVVGALNSNYAFYQGLDAGGAFDGSLTESEMLADVWRQEEEIRAETEEWVYSYLGMAYRPLDDDEIAAYTALSRTPEGQALNAALFGAFEVLFNAISRDLGLAAAQMMAGEDI